MIATKEEIGSDPLYFCVPGNNKRPGTLPDKVFPCTLAADYQHCQAIQLASISLLYRTINLNLFHKKALGIYLLFILSNPEEFHVMAAMVSW